MNQNVQALQKAMSEETSTQDLQLAQRNVARIVSKHATLEAFDELVALYCGPRKLRGGDAWINAKLLETWSAKVTQSVLKTAYWVLNSMEQEDKDDLFQDINQFCATHEVRTELNCPDG
ncbi:unnamed protein product, partial [Effrenium voratum]